MEGGIGAPVADPAGDLATPAWVASSGAALVEDPAMAACAASSGTPPRRTGASMPPCATSADDDVRVRDAAGEGARVIDVIAPSLMSLAPGPERMTPRNTASVMPPATTNGAVELLVLDVLTSNPILWARQTITDPSSLALLAPGFAPLGRQLVSSELPASRGCAIRDDGGAMIVPFIV
jgi:hypothetical protein